MKPRELCGACAFAIILVALLTPVLQRRDPSAQQLDRWRDVANAFFNYTENWDDTCPLSMSFNTVTNRWRTDTYHWVPVGSSVRGNRHREPRRTEESSVFSNALLPYLSSHLALVDDELPHVPETLPALGVVMTYSTNVTYNGQLHGYSLHAVTSPGRLVVLLQHYRQNSMGYSIALPMLCCTDSGPECRFNPKGYPQPGQRSCAYYGAGYGYVWHQSVPTENFSVWVHGNGEVMVQADGSVRMKTLDAPIWPRFAVNVNDNPWSSFGYGEVQGAPYWMTDCVQPGGTTGGDNVFYSGFFRPDSEFTYTERECDFGGG